MSTAAGIVDAETEAVEADVCCANCGIAGVDNVKLEECNDCDLVKYCGEKCREEHREEHAGECKIRAKELHDRKLFTQPDGTHLGECPLCFLPMPIDEREYMFWSCCSSCICLGCLMANFTSNKFEFEKAGSCPFCRTPASKSKGEPRKRMMKRIKANDSAAMTRMAVECHKEGDYERELEYLTKAAELEDADAHYELGNMYDKGEGVEKDEEKAVYHFEKAAIGGHPHARNNLACVEEDNYNTERAVKHFIIAASLGYDGSMKALWGHYSLGNITKEDLDATLRAHQAAIDAMKSPQRKIAVKFYQELYK